MKRSIAVFLVLCAIAGLPALAGCSSPAAESSAPLRIGVTPLMKSLPLHVAIEEGYFRSEGVAVELVPFTGSRESEAAIQAGKVDAVFTNLVTVIVLRGAGVEIRAVTTARYAGAANAILSAPKSPIRTPQDLRGVAIAGQFNSSSEYNVMTLLRAAGLKDDEIKMTEVSSMQVRLEMLVSGVVEAATLGEPLASLAVHKGAHRIVDDEAGTTPPTVAAFRLPVLQERPQAVRKFLRAYQRGVEAINANPDKYAPIFIQKANIPAELVDSLSVPRFLDASAPDKGDTARLIDWMVSRGMLKSRLPYERIVDAAFLP